jgi:polyphosphate kinase
MIAADRPEAALFISRELSWLAFNERVLEEAADPSVALLERVKFAAIAASNLDEFFMVRVAGLQQAVDEGDTACDLSGLTAAQQLAAVAERAHRFVGELYRLVGDDLLPALTAQRTRLLAFAELNEAQRVSMAAFFRDSVLPVLTPLAIDVERPFPLLLSLSLNLAVLLDAEPGETRHRLGIVQVPSGIGRLTRIPEPEGAAFVLLEDIIRAHLPQLFPGQPILEASVIRLARDAEMEFDDEGGRTQLELVERELRRRRRSDVVRLEVEASASQELIDRLCTQLDVPAESVYPVRGPIDLRVLMGLVDLPGFEERHDPPLQPVNVIAGEQTDLFSILDQRDVLLHHPYEAYDPVMALVAQAADDPDVLAIKQTLYRTSIGSPMIASLQRAAECNKQVTVILELTARFDEERNIRWARALEEVGAHVIYGVRGYKVHAKACLIVRRTPRGLRRYVHLGTGNYNERTARIYTDFGLLTASRKIAEDISAFFSALTGYSDPPRLNKLVMAPTGLRQRFLRLIDRERRRAEAGQPAEITAKMNSLIDGEIIEALYAASRAGVRIQLNVRGICALRPGMPDASENIEVVSVVDRFLEHSRIYCFLNGGDEEVYLASADWMTRNLDKRIELMFPIEDALHKAKVLGALRAMFRDTVKSRWLGGDGRYHRRGPSPGELPFRAQHELLLEARRSSVTREGVGITFHPQQHEPSRSQGRPKSPG